MVVLPGCGSDEAGDASITAAARRISRALESNCQRSTPCRAASDASWTTVVDAKLAFAVGNDGKARWIQSERFAEIARDLGGGH